MSTVDTTDKNGLPIVNPNPVWKDVSGREVTVGSYILYAASVRRDTVLKFGLVTELIYKDVTNWQWDAQSRKQWQQTTRVPKIRAVMSWRGTARTARIYDHMDRMMVIDQAQIPTADREAIGKLWVGSED